jgi:V8-like Glu-specific endopeptidase
VARSIESPFLDAESFAAHEGLQDGWQGPVADEGPPVSFEQFDDVRELWTREDPASPEQGRGADEESDGEAEAFEQESDEDKCSESGFGIIGNDDRRPVPDTATVPFRWVCQLWVKREGPRGRVKITGGTGVLVSPRHVLTCAHIVREDKQDDQGQWAKWEATQIRVRPARDGSTAPFGVIDVKLPAQIAPGWNPRTLPHGHDYALLTLDKAVGDDTFKALGGKRLGYWGSKAHGAGSVFQAAAPAVVNGRTATTAGYPKDVGNGETMISTDGRINGADVRSRTMSITADACQGQSGSPVWLDEATGPCLVGMMVAVFRGVNLALRVTDDVCAQLRHWMKGASDACAPRPATSGIRPQPELESSAGTRCRCGAHSALESAEEAEGGDIIDHARHGGAEGEFDDEFEERDESAADADEYQYQAGEPVLTGDEEFESEEPEDEAWLAERELDPSLLDLAERTMARESPFAEGEVSRFTTCFSAADAGRVKQAYADNAAAAAANDGDRCSCIVMLNVALGQLLPLKLKDNRARGTSARRVRMGALTTESIEQAMAQLRRNGLAAAPVRMDFYDHRKRTAGTLKPEELKASVQDKVLALSQPEGCWYAYGLSIMDGYHSVLLLVDRTAAAGRIYWLDQFSSGLDTDVTTTLDAEITGRTQRWWQHVMATKKKGYNTTIRLWRLQKPKRSS